VEFKADSSLKRVKKNGLLTAVHFAVYTLSSFWFIPFLVNQYGDGTYGLIALAGFLTQYVGFIAGCIGSSIGRFLNIALNKNDWVQANEIFSTAIVGILVLIVLQVPFFVWGIWKLDWLIGFPPEMGTDFRVLVACKVVVFLASILMGVIYTPIQAANRLDIGLTVNIVGQLVRLLLLVMLILRIGPKLWIIGVVDLLMFCVGTVAMYFFYRQLARNLVFKRKHITGKWVRPVMNMAGWSIVAGLGQILFQKTDVLIINRFVDFKLAGICAALLIWPNFVQQIAKNISSLLMPVVMIDYSRGHFQRIRDLVLLTSQLLCLMSLFACGGVMVLGDWLLELWMGAGYRQYQWVLVLMLLHFPLTLTREAIWLVFPAFNKMKDLGISNLISGVLNIILSLLLVFMGFGLAGVIIATGLSLVLQRTLFLTWFAAKTLDIEYRKFIRIYTGGILLVVAVAVQWVFFKNSDFVVVGMACMAMAVAILARLCIFDPRFRMLIDSLLKKEKTGEDL